jgi:D-tyrosyl-tRNA(Tyr) deacylase
MARKIVELRIFEDETGKMNRSVQDVDGSLLLVSQFTLYGDTRKGRRPSYIEAAPPETAEALYESCVEECSRMLAPDRVESGQFRAMMEVELVNDGPVTILVEVDSGQGRG